MNRTNKETTRPRLDFETYSPCDLAEERRAVYIQEFEVQMKEVLQWWGNHAIDADTTKVPD